MRRIRRAAIAVCLASVIVGSVGVVDAGAASLVTDWTQCANEHPTLGVCTWINGIVQQSNSKYYEGMAVPQRAFFDNITATAGNAHGLTFFHEATKAGIHAYDFLTSYDQALSTASALGNAFSTLSPCLPGPASPATFTVECTALRAGSNFIDVTVPNDAFISKDGSTQSRIDAFETAFGNRTIRIWGNAPITAASLTLAHSVTNGNDTGDSDINYSLTWTSAATKILVEMAGHISIGPGPLGWGAGLGASSISGGPYHFKLSQLDGASLGSQDNQLKGADILVASGIVTVPVPAEAVIGAEIHDTATITGAEPTGTVTFRLFGPGDDDCSGPAIFTSTVAVTGVNATTSSATSGTFTPSVAGTYYWTAEYSGDDSNIASTSDCGDEVVVLSKATPTLTTAPNAPTVVVGNPIFDVATITGGFSPTGTIDFALYGPGDVTCTTNLVAGDTDFLDIPLVGGVATSPSFLTDTVGTYRWIAHYSGDDNNNAVSGTCGDTTEHVVSEPASPAISTNQSPGGVIGVTIFDTATVSGGFDPTGTVTFELFAPSDPTCEGTPVFTSTTPLIGDLATSGIFITDAVGTFHWIATYNGDANNNTAVSGCDEEPVTMTQATPTIATVPSAGGTVGIVISDVANVSGGFAPTGTVTFRLYGANDDDCSGDPIFTSAPVALNGGTATSPTFTPTGAGTYQWIATYNGDENNAAVSGVCGDEPVTLTSVLPRVLKKTGTDVRNLLAVAMVFLLMGLVMVRGQAPMAAQTAPSADPRMIVSRPRRSARRVFSRSVRRFRGGRLRC